MGGVSSIQVYFAFFEFFNFAKPLTQSSLFIISLQILTKDAMSLQHKLSFYFSSVWNKFDAIAHSLFLISILLRFTVSDRNFVWPRMSYCLTLSMYYIRFMQAFYVQKNIGPKVIMVRRMVGLQIMVHGCRCTSDCSCKPTKNISNGPTSKVKYS